MRKWLAVTIIILVLCPVAFAAIIEPLKEEPTEKPTIEPTKPQVITEPNELTTTKVIYEGARSITAALTTASQQKSGMELSTYEKAVVLAAEMDKLLEVEKYPYTIEKTEITILKYRCTGEICGYWISATRNGKEVKTNSPVWISPPPYQAFISESFDSVKNEQIIILKEDPKLAVSQVLQGYCDRQSLGKAVVGTKE